MLFVHLLNFSNEFFVKIFPEYNQGVKKLWYRSGPTKCRVWSGSKLFPKPINRWQKKYLFKKYWKEINSMRKPTKATKMIPLQIDTWYMPAMLYRSHSKNKTYMRGSISVLYANFSFLLSFLVYLTLYLIDTVYRDTFANQTAPDEGLLCLLMEIW